MITPKISVVIPLYNKADHIARAIESVLAQITRPYEVIVIDDGSTDQSPLIASAYGEKGVKLVRQENQGASAARNTGIHLARGDHIAFLDADDEWLPNHLTVIDSLIKDYPNAVLFSTAHFISRNHIIFKPASNIQENWSGLIEDFFETYSLGLSLINSTTACAKKDALLAIGGFPVGIKRGEDVITWIRLALLGKAAHAGKVTAIYHLDTTDRPTRKQEIEPPGSLVYLSELILSKQLSRKDLAGAIKLFRRISFFTAAGFVLNGWKEGTRSIRRLAWQTRQYDLTVLLYLLVLIPPSLLKIARNMRHKKLKEITNKLCLPSEQDKCCSAQ